MKIGIVAPIDRRTGISLYSIILASNLSDLGEEVTLISPDIPHFAKFLKQTRHVDILPINRLFGSNSNFDLLHFQLGNSLFHEFQVHNLKKLNGYYSPIITTVHDPRNLKAIDMRCSKCFSFYAKGWLHHPIISPVEIVDMAFQKLSDGLIFHSNYLMKNYISKHNYGGRISVISHPGYRTSINLFHHELKNENPAINLNDTKRLIVPGYVSPFKGADIIIEAVSEIEGNFKLIFLGKIINRKYEEYLNTLIKKHKLKEKIKFTGFVDDEYYMKELDNAYIVLVPRLISPWYKKTLPFRMRKIINFGYQVDQATSGVLTEALAAGKAIVCSKTQGYSEYVNKERGILCENNKESWRYAIETLLNNPDVVREMGNQSLKFVHDRISPKKTAKDHILFYKEVLENV